MNIDHNTIVTLDELMQFEDNPFDHPIEDIPSYPVQVIDECTKCLGVKPCYIADDSFQCDKDKIFCGMNTLCNRVLTEDWFSDIRIRELADETYLYSNADTFACGCAHGLDFMYPESEDVDMGEQLRIFWHVVQDPFDVLLEKLGLTAEECGNRFYIASDIMHEWLNGGTNPPDSLRLMMANATGLLAIRDLDRSDYSGICPILCNTQPLHILPRRSIQGRTFKKVIYRNM